MSSAQVGPGGGQVGPGGGELGPTLEREVPSGVLTLVGGVPLTDTDEPRAQVGPESGQVGPGGGLVGPGEGYAVIRVVEPGVITLSGGATIGDFVEPGILRLVPPTDHFPAVDASWLRDHLIPILTATEPWEGDDVEEPRVIVGMGVLVPGLAFRMWYRAHGWPTIQVAIGYAECLVGDDPTDPGNWVKHPDNPVYGMGGSGIADQAALPTIVRDATTLYLFVVRRAFSTDNFQAVATSPETDGLDWTTQAVTMALPAGKTLWGNAAVWREDDGTWARLQEAGPTPWEIYLYTSPDALAWTIGNAGAPLTSLQVAAGGMYGGPAIATDEEGNPAPKFDGLYHVWGHAAPNSGNLPTNIYHWTSPDLIAWTLTAPSPVLTHAGAGFEIDQVADPAVLVRDGVAFLFYDGDDNGAGAASIGIATAAPIGGITLLGIGDSVTSTIHLPFDIGSVDSTIHLPFSILGPPVTSTIHLPFTLRGAAGSTIHLPFDIEGPVTSTIHLPFDIVASPTGDEVQVITPGGVVAGGTYTLTYDGQTTAPIAAGANAATVQAALVALSNLAPGDVVVTGGPLAVAALTLTFGGALAGVDVPQITVDASSLTGTGATAQGTTVINGGPVSTGGLAVRGIPRVWQPLMVFDKAGAYQGSISAFNVTNPPVRYLRSMRVTNEGAMTLNVSRHSPDVALVASDNLVLLQSPQGEKPWWGTMSHEVDARGILERPCKDPWTLLRDGPAIVLEEDVNDDTPASAVMAKVMAMHNDLRAATGEIQWELDLQGTRPFRGDIDFDADTLSCIDTIISRSRTEIAWDSRLEGNRLVPILRMRDRFDAGAGAAVFDGPDGNVTSGVQVIEDPTPLVFNIRLRGLTTDLASCLPEWAQWALLNITPEVTVSVDPGRYRNRQRLEESVDWGLSKRQIAAQCNAILDWLWGLYHSYLMALHDIEGRPNHVGWAFLGPPDTYEPKTNGKDSMSRRAWKTRLQLVEVRPEEPASAVMISETSSQINLREWLIVRYNRVTGVQNVTVWAIESATGLSLVKWEVDAGGTTLFRVSGDRVVSRSTIAATGAFVDPYNTPVWDPVARRTRQLRRIINGPFALAYYIDPADGDNSFVDLGVDAAISTTSGDGSSLISKVYPFERFAIEDWDPRRDGIGQRLARPTVFFGAETSRPRWHLVSFNVGGDANTSLTHGISSGEQDIEVDSIHGFPDPDLDTIEFPFLAAIDDGLNEEQVLVVSMIGTLWHVIRGQGGTDPIIHEAGASIRRFGAEDWEGFPWTDERRAWPEGEQWAREELEELSKPRIDLDVHVAHFRGDQLTVDYGSMHAVDVATEGPAGRWSGEGRVIGWSTDPGHAPTADDPTPPGGDTEVVLEWQQ